MKIGKYKLVKRKNPKGLTGLLIALVMPSESIILCAFVIMFSFQMRRTLSRLFLEAKLETNTPLLETVSRSALLWFIGGVVIFLTGMAFIRPKWIKIFILEVLTPLIGSTAAYGLLILGITGIDSQSLLSVAVLSLILLSALFICFFEIKNENAPEEEPAAILKLDSEFFHGKTPKERAAYLGLFLIITLAFRFIAWSQVFELLVFNP